MAKDWFDIAVGLAQIITAWGVLAAFKQAKVTQKQLEITQAQLEEERKNSKPEVIVTTSLKDANKRGIEEGKIHVYAINVKNVPVFVSDYYLEIITKSGSVKYTSSLLEGLGGFRSTDFGVLSGIGRSFVVSIPASFFCEPFKGKETFSSTEILNLERIDIGFKVPGISPDPTISFTLIEREMLALFDDEEWMINTLGLYQIHGDKLEEITRWEIGRERIVEDEIS